MLDKVKYKLFIDSIMKYFNCSYINAISIKFEFLLIYSFIQSKLFKLSAHSNIFQQLSSKSNSFLINVKYFSDIYKQLKLF